MGSGNSANGGSSGQVAECITVGGNSPITGSCTNGDADMNVNTGGTFDTNHGTTAPVNHDTTARTNTGGIDRLPLPTFS